MTAPATLFKPPAPAPFGLTDRQQWVWDYICSVPGGVSADEAGAWLHTKYTKRPHSVDERCEYCTRDAFGVLRSVALRPLLIRRKTSNRYEPRNPAYRAPEPSSQLAAELPGETFADLFGRVA